MKQLGIALSFAVFILACQSGVKPAGDMNAMAVNRDTLLLRIKSLEQTLSEKKVVDYNSGGAMVQAYLDFFDHYPKDGLSADFLFKAADVSMNLKQSEKAIELFKKVVEFYPDYKKASFALFLQAFVYETQLHDLAQAKTIYNQVVEQYPNTKIADDAKASVANLGKSDEELIKELEKKNKAK